MQAQIVTPVGVHALDTGGPAIPCHRCGLCCERWQPLLTRADSERLAAHLGLSAAAFEMAYIQPYPLDDERRLLRQVDGHCVFLRYEGRHTTCTVHPARPQACRDWQPGLSRKECMEGLARFADAAGLIRLEDLYPDEADRREALRALAPRGFP